MSGIGRYLAADQRGDVAVVVHHAQAAERPGLSFLVAVAHGHGPRLAEQPLGGGELPGAECCLGQRLVGRHEEITSRPPRPGRHGRQRIPARRRSDHRRGGTAGHSAYTRTNPAVRQITARILRRNGYSVLEAASGAEELTLAADHHFDMLLTDLVMPQVSGPELAQRIQQMHPGIPMLFMSGYSQDVLGPHGALDADAPLIQKPFAAPDLLKTIRTLLS